MATITELDTSCAIAHSAASFTFGLNVAASTANATSSVNVAGRGFNVASSGAATSTPTPIGKYNVSLLNSALARSFPGDTVADSLHSTANATATATPFGFIANLLASTANAVATTGEQAKANGSATSDADCDGHAIPDGATGIALWVNSKTMAAATWQLPINVDRFAFVRDRLLAAGDNLISFTADDDNGTPVDASIVDDTRAHHDGQESRFVSLYASAKSDGPMQFGVETDENGAYTYQTHLPFSNNFVNHRAVLGRGLVGEYARLSFMNINGKDFDVAAISLYAFARPRKIGG